MFVRSTVDGGSVGLVLVFAAMRKKKWRCRPSCSIRKQNVEIIDVYV